MSGDGRRKNRKPGEHRKRSDSSESYLWVCTSRFPVKALPYTNIGFVFFSSFTDGGGIRGYSTLVILQELMHQIYVQTHDGKGPRTPADLPRPCDYFDLIGGTGTGGLIALMLGRMRMDVESCKDYYVQLTRYVFITDKTVLGVPYGRTLFKSSRLEEAIRHCVRESKSVQSALFIELTAY